MQQSHHLNGKWNIEENLFFQKYTASYLGIVCFFFYMNIVLTNKYNKKLQSPGALNIKETPGYKQKDNLKNNK